MPNDSPNAVSAWEETIVIPTYPAPTPDPNPMFLENRVNQGASGRVYPNPFTDHVSNLHKTDQSYKAVFIENEYIQLMLLPELGGRIHAGFDKTNSYDFFYRQHVVKPALIGLLGSWISGGVEWNWPMHHRPSTFMPVSYVIEKGADGSQTVWLSDHEPMTRTKGMVGICLHPGKAFVEARVRLYNRTPHTQKFLWWANVAVHVNEQYQVFFPPDVTWVTFHARADMSRWPVARGTYCGIDYSQGVDISWWKNNPQATSFFAIESGNDFFGGYDHGHQAGLIHIANRHIAPAKKLFTWGTGDFGKAWERNLTDADGPYIELMAGCYSDNQPDFSWIQPYETKTFTQTWYPIQQIGPAKNANRRAAVNLEVLPQDGMGSAIKVGVYVTEHFPRATVSLRGRQRMLFEQQVDLAPGKPFLRQIELPEGMQDTELLLRVRNAEGHELIRYTPVHPVEKDLPAPATALPAPQDIASNDELYLSGLHLDQYHHATWSPEPYWQEALRRDPGDVRCNNALGLVRLQQGLFAAAESHFRTAIQTLTRRNPNPRDGEPYYHLGLALKYQGRLNDAYAAFYKAIWSYAWQSAGYTGLAEIDCIRCDYDSALEHLDRALLTNAANNKARNLKTAVLRKLTHLAEAEALASATIATDPLDFWARNELILIARERRNTGEAEKRLRELKALLGSAAQTYLDIGLDYANAGLWEEATDWLMRLVPDAQTLVYPMVFYALAHVAEQTGHDGNAREYYKRAAAAPPDFCFPARLEELVILQAALEANPQDARAHAYLGNLLYDRRRYEEAIAHWEHAVALQSGSSTPWRSVLWRNLGIGYYNIHHDLPRARQCYLQAFELNPRDPRLLYELDQLMKKLNAAPAERLARLEQHLDLVQQRDYLAIEQVTLYNQLGRHEQALALLQSRRFFPWEGGEGTVSGQYVTAHIALGRAALDAGDARTALDHFESAQRYPENLGEGKYMPLVDLPLWYFEGLAREMLGDEPGAQDCFRRAADTPTGASELSYYRALALRKLGQEDAAYDQLQALLTVAEQQIHAKGQFAYFGTSVANVLLFQEDLHKLNRIEGGYLAGLAQLGLDRLADAARAFEDVLTLDGNHLGAQEELKRLAVLT